MYWLPLETYFICPSNFFSLLKSKKFFISVFYNFSNFFRSSSTILVLQLLFGFGDYLFYYYFRNYFVCYYCFTSFIYCLLSVLFCYYLLYITASHNNILTWHSNYTYQHCYIPHNNQRNHLIPFKTKSNS